MKHNDQKIYTKREKRKGEKRGEEREERERRERERRERERREREERGERREREKKPLLSLLKHNDQKIYTEKAVNSPLYLVSNCYFVC